MLSAAAPACPLPIRLYGISGYESRTNDVVYCPPSAPEEEPSTLVYFGGDVQDFPEHMLSHRDNKSYIKWNLEDTSSILHSHFPTSHIVVVRPSRIEYKTFSCFENFVPGNNCGAPEHTPTHHALNHLEKLLQRISEKLQHLNEDEIRNAIYKHSEVTFATQQKTFELTFPLWWQKHLNLDKNKLGLIGFSKGCVVLNQCLYEFHFLKTLTPDDNTMMEFVSRVNDMYWLDGGHAGGKNTWITSRSLLETLARLDIRIHVHVTPYQINDDRRPWIRKEEKIFSDILKQLGASVNRVLHFENAAPSLLMHFDVLTAFAKATE